MKTVLVVEDEYVLAHMIEDLLQDEGYEVMIALNGVEGLHCLEQAIPKVIITDLMMPIMDGLVFCRKVQEQPKYQAIPIVIVSAVSDRSKLLECHWSAIIPKPFDIDDLLETLERVWPA